MKHNECNAPLLTPQLQSIVQQTPSKKLTADEQKSHAVNLRLSAFICGFVLKLIANKYSSMSQIFSYQCKSVPSAKSAFHRTDSRIKSTVQTGLTGWTGYGFNYINNFEELGV